MKCRTRDYNRSYRKCISMVMLSLLFILSSSCGILDDDDKDPTWTVADSPYNLLDTSIVEPGTVLTIEPGVTVEFGPDAALIIKGQIDAQGTAGTNIVFTSTDGAAATSPRNWNGIVFENCSDSSIMSYCLIEYVGCLKIIDSSPTISHCTVRNVIHQTETGGAAIVCEGISFPLIEYNIISDFSNCHASGIYCWSPANPVIAHNDIYCNAHFCDEAVSGGGFLRGNYLAAQVWDGEQLSLVPLLSLGGWRTDEVGDNECTTDESASHRLFGGVDGVTDPRATPNFPNAGHNYQEELSFSSIVIDVFVSNLMEIEDYYYNLPEEELYLENAHLSGDMLHLSLSYQGCNERQFALNGGPTYLTLPPRSAIWLTWDTENDTGSTQLSADLKFDLTPLKYLHRCKFSTGPSGDAYIGLGILAPNTIGLQWENDYN